MVYIQNFELGVPVEIIVKNITPKQNVDYSYFVDYCCVS